MARRDRLPDILLDFDFYTKPRNVAFIHRHGAKGIVALQSIWLMLSQEKDWCLPEECLQYSLVCGAILAKEPFTESEWAGFLTDAVRVGLLEARKCSGQLVYFNSRIAANGEKFVNKRENYRNGKRKRDEERRSEESNKSKGLPKTVAELCQDSGTIITEHGTRNTISTESTSSFSYVLPPQVGSSLQVALQSWNKLQQEKYRRKVSQVEVDSLLMHWSPRFEELEAAIIYSTSNGWKNIREKTSELPSSNGQTNGAYPQKKTAQQLKEERVKALHAKFKAEEEKEKLYAKIGHG